MRSMALSGRKPVRNEPGGQCGGAADRFFGDIYVVMVFIAALDTHQDREGVVLVRFFDPDRLQAALQRGVPLDVLAVVVQSRGADTLHLAAGQGWLQYVGGVDRPLGGSSSNDGVNLVDE